jgi:hypothetical protein
MRLLKLIPMALVALQAGAIHAAEDLAVDVQRTGALFSVRARARIEAPAALAWEALTDYDSLARFIPGLSRSRLLLREGHRAVVEQQGEARFLIFSYPIEVRYEVQESPFAWVVSRGVAGNLKRMNGRYDLQSDGGRLVLRYAGELEPDFDLPPLVGALAVRSMVEEQFTAMVAEIERRAAQAR